MSASLKPMSKREAINTILLNSGIDMVNSLDEDQDADVAAAIFTLDRVSRQVQSEGYRFNSEEKFPLHSSMTTGKIRLPDNTLSFTPCDFGSEDLTQRGQFLYDRKNHTFIFERTVAVDIVFYLDFEELPASARNYIAIRAAREFQDDAAPSEIGLQTAPKEEAQARAQFLREHGKTGRLNMLSNPRRI